MAAARPRTNPWLVLAIVGGGIAVAVLIAVVLGPRGSDSPSWALDDSSCRQTGGLVSYTGTITNNDSKTRTYYMTASFTGASGVREDTDAATVRDVAPGETARWRFLARAGGDDTTCRVIDVEVR